MSPQPTIVEVLAPIIADLPPEEQPLLAALAERVAAKRYRAWAEAVSDSAARDDLLACAEREEEIARRVEALFPDPAGFEKRFRQAHPDLEERYVRIFGSAPLAEQWAIQADAERAGSNAWQAFAARETDPARAEALRACGPLEEQSAAVLDALCARGAAG